MNRNLPILLMVLSLLLMACDALAASTPTETALPPTATASPQPSALPTQTALPTTAPTSTPQPTLTPVPSNTPLPTATLPPTQTPEPAVGFVFDNWNLVELPLALQGGVDRPYVIFINSNDQQTIANIATAQPSTDLETVYFVAPDNPERLPVLELSSATGTRVYPAAAGTALAYFRSAGADTGLYILNLENGLSGRVIPIPTLTQRGFLSEPSWSPDGEYLAIALATGYDMDIFAYDRGGSGRQSLTPSGSYDFWPAYSPDGTRLAFVSDRLTCPSWIPGDDGACVAGVDAPPTGGQLFVLELATGQVTLISEEFVGEPPRWINNRLIAFASGDQMDLLNPQRALWLANTSTGTVQQVVLPEDAAGDANYLSDVWAPDGSRVLFQRASAAETEIVMMRPDGALIDRISELSFPRFGMAATWSADGSRIALGGVDGQCPYGIRVIDSNFESVARGNPPPSMCNPAFSADGQFLAFTGINPRVDGRVDVYVANFNGFGANNLTVDLRGQVDLIGLIGGVP